MIIEHEVVHEIGPGYATGDRIVFDERYEKLCTQGCVELEKRTWVRAYQKQGKAEVMFRCRGCKWLGHTPNTTEQEMIARLRIRNRTNRQEAK
jgi:hypothetical protein